MRTGHRKAIAKRDAEHLGGGRYRLLEQLGRGGMSVVWRAHDDLLDRPVAIKVLSSKFASDAAFRQRIRVEARAAAGLAHPHVTAVYDYGESRLTGGVTVPYVVMELVDGEALADLLHRTGPMAWQPAVTMGVEVATALAAAHAHGVVHRDVTTHNVMLTSAGAKVVDFGISALVGQNDAAADGSLLGTPAYLAPERLTGGPVSPAADVYALGLVLYRALTGRLPWPAESTAAVLRAHLWTDPAPLPPIDGLPAIVADLCMRCLDKVPTVRPTSAELARGLAGTVGLRPVLPSAPAHVVTGPDVAAAGRPDRGPVDLTGRRPGTRRAGRARPPRFAHSRRGRRAATRAAGAGRGLRAAATSLGLLLAASVGWAMSDRSAPEPTVQAAAPAQVVVGVPAPSEGCRVRFHVRRDSGTAFDAAVTVTNTGDAPISAWRLEFAFRGDQQVDTVRAATADQSGRRVVVRPGETAPLTAGESVNMSFTGRYDDSNQLPAAFRVGGLECTSVVTAVAADDADDDTVTAAEKPAKRKSTKSSKSSSGGSAASSSTTRSTSDASAADSAGSPTSAVEKAPRTAQPVPARTTKPKPAKSGGFRLI